MALALRTKEEREYLRQILHAIVIRDLSTFTREKFGEWIDHTNSQLKRVGLILAHTVRDRGVTFVIKQVKTDRLVHRFQSATYLRFSDE